MAARTELLQHGIQKGTISRRSARNAKIHTRQAECWNDSEGCRGRISSHPHLHQESIMLRVMNSGFTALKATKGISGESPGWFPAVCFVLVHNANFLYQSEIVSFQPTTLAHKVLFHVFCSL